MAVLNKKTELIILSECLLFYSIFSNVSKFIPHCRPINSETWTPSFTIVTGLTQYKGDVFPGEKPSQQLGGGVKDARKSKVVGLTDQILHHPHGDRGEVNDGERGVIPPWPHDITGQRVVSELSLAVEKRVTIEMDVTVIAGGSKGQGTMLARGRVECEKMNCYTDVEGVGERIHSITDDGVSNPF